MKAVGKRCTKAVASRTPVPKWRMAKKKGFGMRRTGNFLASRGRPDPKLETPKMMNRAPTCSGTSYSAAFTPELSQVSWRRRSMEEEERETGGGAGPDTWTGRMEDGDMTSRAKERTAAAQATEATHLTQPQSWD